jgi:dsDNA-specific endonuclease/ATPase MutS2
LYLNRAAQLSVHSSAGRSNALNIASRLGLDTKIIEAARERLAVGVAAANAAIEALESVQQEAREADMVLFAVTANAAETKVCLGVVCLGSA